MYLDHGGCSKQVQRPHSCIVSCGLQRPILSFRTRTLHVWSAFLHTIIDYMAWGKLATCFVASCVKDAAAVFYVTPSRRPRPPLPFHLPIRIENPPTQPSSVKSIPKGTTSAMRSPRDQTWTDSPAGRRIPHSDSTLVGSVHRGQGDV